MQNNVLILDFGSQYTQLIARRVRELNIYCEIHPFHKVPEDLSTFKAVILSGSPFSVRGEDAPQPDLSNIKGKLPLLGVCYGAQYLAHFFGGKVEASNVREYGRANLSVIKDKEALFASITENSQVWMSHGDATKILPDNFESIATTENSPYAAIRSNNLFGVQFHPEVTHTKDGRKILSNFIYEICGCKGLWTMDSFVDNAIDKIKTQVGKDSVLCALSGGVDSSTVALLLHKAIGDRLTCVFVDHGLLRKDEAKNVLEIFDKLDIKIIFYNEADRFLDLLLDVIDPEERRKLIGREFIKVFEEISKQNGSFKWLAQGTLYPDVIESASTNGLAVTIKTHHNVGGLPETIDFKLIEPPLFIISISLPDSP